MKLSQFFLLLGILLTLICCSGTADQSKKPFPLLKGEYLGQKRPGKVPVLFAAGIISTQYMESVPVFSPDKTEVYWSRLMGRKGEILASRVDNNYWTKPESISFSQPEFLDSCPSLTRDGQKMLFISRRPIEGNIPAPGCFGLWTTNRTEQGWTVPVPLGPDINKGYEDFAVLAGDGTLYFTSWRPDGPGKSPAKIYFSQIVNGQYSNPKILPASINTAEGAVVDYVAPDQGYIIFESERVSGFGHTDLYISFGQKDASWGPAINMGKGINTPGYEHFASVSPDGAYLFFCSDRSGNLDVYWVEAKIIEELKSI